MINTSLFAINIVLAIIIWRKMLRPSIVDMYRDKLFDLREEVRSFYQGNSRAGLDDPTYRALRDMLNGYLRLMEEITLGSAMYAISRMREGTGDRLMDEINRILHSDDERIAGFIADVRSRAGMELFAYMVASSPMVWLFFTALDLAGKPFRLAARIYDRYRPNLEEMSYTAGVCCAGSA